MTTQTFGPYSPIRQAGNTYYISGQVGVDPETKQAPADIASQTKQVMRNMQTVLAEAGLQLSDVVKVGIMLRDMADFTIVNETYQTYFEPPRPARSTVAVRELPRVGGENPILVEIEAIAHKSDAGGAQ
ncbi:reactive intermediate/imine deaminase [Candidatus Saccharibacteria bacterium]|nr:MAG: reactive intermediate/imine deaminase [Candidatus Saccharibacteria bacterium]